MQTRNSWSAVLAEMLLGLSGAAASAGEWTQWGGPHRNFMLPSEKVAAWSDAGPQKLWERDLGDGYSAILVEGDKLYTMYRRGDNEVVVCLNRSSGETVWEHAYEAKPDLDTGDMSDVDNRPKNKQNVQFGSGPNATPLLVDDLLYTIGFTAKLHALDKRTGKVVWATDLVKDHGGTVIYFGYSSSPVHYKDMLMVPVGGSGQGVIAFDLATGKPRWKSGNLEASYSSPILATIEGREQLIVFASTEVVGLDPASGTQLWSHPHVNQWKTNIPTPIWSGDALYVTSFGDTQTRRLQFSGGGDAVKVSEKWATKKFKLGQTTGVLHDGLLIGATGEATQFLTAVDVATGEVLWKERGYPQANVLLVDGGKLLVLDENGTLTLAQPSKAGVQVLAKTKIFDGRSWTVPTLVDGQLFVRDRATIKALKM